MAVRLRLRFDRFSREIDFGAATAGLTQTCDREHMDMTRVAGWGTEGIWMSRSGYGHHAMTADTTFEEDCLEFDLVPRDLSQ